MSVFLSPQSLQGLYNGLLNEVSTVGGHREGGFEWTWQHEFSLTCWEIKLIKLLLLLKSNLSATETNAESLLRCHFSRRSSSYLGESFYFDLPFTLKVPMIHSDRIVFYSSVYSPFLPWLASLPKCSQSIWSIDIGSHIILPWTKEPSLWQGRCDGNYMTMESTSPTTYHTIPKLDGLVEQWNCLFSVEVSTWGWHPVWMGYHPSECDVHFKPMAIICCFMCLRTKGWK